MLQAVKRFDTDRGFRITTYAIWWVRAAIQEYILRSWMAEVIPRRLFADTLRLVVRLRAVASASVRGSNNGSSAP